MKISNPQHGPIALQPFRSDQNNAHASLELQEIAAARNFPGKISRMTLQHAKGTLLQFEISLQPFFELRFEEKTDKAKLLVMTEGEMTLRLASGERQWELAAGQCAVFHTAQYTIFHSSDSGFQFLLFETEPLGEWLNWTAFEEGRYSCTGQMDHHIKIIQHPPPLLPLPGEWLAIQLLNVLMHLRQYLYISDASYQQKSDHKAYALAAEAFIQANLHRKITIEEICRAVGLNECYLKNVFKAVFKMPLIKRHSYLRLEMAKRLLLYTTKSIAAIAAECGYGTDEAFRSSFNLSNNDTPLIWRQKNKK